MHASPRTCTRTPVSLQYHNQDAQQVEQSARLYSVRITSNISHTVTAGARHSARQTESPPLYSTAYNSVETHPIFYYLLAPDTARDKPFITLGDPPCDQPPTIMLKSIGFCCFLAPDTARGKPEHSPFNQPPTILLKPSTAIC